MWEVVFGVRGSSEMNAQRAVKRRPLSPELVLDTAIELADSQGLDSVTLTQVAKELGTSQPALYRHVESYDELIRALGLRGREVLADRLIESAVGLAGDDAIEAMGRAWRQVVVDHPGLYAATDRYPCAGDAELEAAVNRVVEVLSLALTTYDLSDDERVDAARALRSAFHGFAHLETGDGHPKDQDIDVSFTQLIDLLCRGIRTI